MNQHDNILSAWIKAEATVPSKRQHEDFRQFLDWLGFYGLRMPVGGEEVAAYLLEMMADGASLAVIKRAAASIAACYAQRRCFLDMVPVKAALALAAAQLNPNRVLN
jgi:hypothetical protein